MSEIARMAIELGNLRFILGRSGSGKTTTIIREIAAQLAEDPLGDPILLLVPDQATLLYERLSADAVEAGGYLRLSVITFRQLTELLLREGGGAAIPEVTPLGRRILIGRLLRRFQPQLEFYRSSARQPGLADRLDEAFAEVERADLSADDLDRIATEIAGNSADSALPAKLRDIRLLMAEYDRLLGSDRLDQHRRLQQALEATAKSSLLPKSKLYVDGFDEFTRAERQMLRRVALAGCPTTIALAMEPADASRHAQAQPLPDDHPFRAATYTFRKIVKALSDEGQLPPTIVALKDAPRFKASDLLHISKQFLNTKPGSINAASGLKFLEAPNARAEVDAAAREIVDWLRSGLRLRDILVLARDVDAYAKDVEASFTEHGLAHFVDRRQPASHHPLVRTVRSLVQIALTDWRHDAVAELVKSGLVGVGDDDSDALENYLLAHRIRGLEAWQSPWTFKIGRRDDDSDDDDDKHRSLREDNERVNVAREHLRAGLEPLLECDDTHACTAVQWCQRMCESLARLGADATLSKWIADLEAANDVAAAARHREVWTSFTELLDQLAEVLGDEPLNLREFAEVIDVAFERFVYAIAPPTVDQVLVGSVDRTRAGPVKACIVLGLSEGIFPRRREDARVLSDDDRKLLGDRQAELRPGTRIAQLDEQLFAYQAFTAASEKLVIMRPTRDDDGRRLAPSLFWTQVKSLFRNPPCEVVADDPCGECISTPRDLALAVLHWSRDDEDRAAAGTTAAQLIAFAKRSDVPSIVSLREAVARARRYRNDATLSPEIAAALFQSPLKTSATRLETFAACPFKHFAQHALRLTPREQTRLTPLDLGVVYHRMLDRLVRAAIRAGHDFSKPLPQLNERLGQLGEEAAAELRSELLLSRGRHEHLLSSVRRTLEDVIETQRLALSMGSFRPAGTEFAFGLDENGTPALEIATPRGRAVALRGKIDRVDTIEIADQLAATVVDYKLGKRQANFDQIYFGLSLQLVTYLLVLSALGQCISGKDVAPAAAFYVKLLRQVESVDHPDDAAEIGCDDFYLTTPNKARGVIDEHYVDGIDLVTLKGTSKAYALTRNDKPIELRRADVLEHEMFESLLTWTRKKIALIGDEIMGGNVKVSPYRLRTLTPCSVCSYKSVCRFEVAENGYAFIQPKGAKRLEQISVEATR